MKKSPKKKIVLAYSGGLDTSVLLSWIKEHHNAEIIAFCANVGQEDELDGLPAKARKTGAAKLLAQAINLVTSEGKTLTKDLGGNSSTTEVGNAISSALTELSKGALK